MKVGLSLAFISLSIAIFFARSTSPSFYELSIYAETPLIVWILIGVCALGSVSVAVFQKGTLRFAGVFASLLAVLSVAWMPMIRGYYFFDEYDAMTNLGQAIGVANGSLDPGLLFYPAIHLLAATLAHILGRPPRVTLAFVSLWALVPWVLLVGAATHRIVGTRLSFVLGVGCALLLAPLNPLNVLLAPHASTQAIFISGLTIFALIVLFRQRDWRFVILFVVGFGALQLFHPQQAINILIFGIVVWIALEASRGRSPLPKSALLAGGAFIAYSIMSHPVFESGLRYVVISLISAGNSGGVSGRVSALDALNISLPLLALKLGAKDLIVGVLSLLSAGYWANGRRDFPIPQFIIATLPIMLFGVTFAVVGNANQVVRYIGVVVALLTIVAGVGLTYAHRSLETRFSRPTANSVVVVVLLFGILVAAPTFHPSPHTSRYGVHVPEGQFEGFETVLEYVDDDAQFARVRSEAFRYEQASSGITSHEEETRGYFSPDPVPDHFRNLNQPYDGTYYLPITHADVRRDSELYDGFRYSESDFNELQGHPGLQRVYDNRHLRLYYRNNESIESGS